MFSGRDKVGIRALIAIVELWCIVLCFLFTTATMSLNYLCRILVLVFRCLNFIPCLFRIRRRAQNIPATEPAEEGEYSFQGEVPPDPPRRRRGRGRGRPRVAVAQEVEQEPIPEQEVPMEGQAGFTAGMAGINQGLAALNQAMPLVQQMLQQRNQEMSDADVTLLYSRVGRVPFHGTGDTMDFINTIEARTRTGYNDYQRIMVVELSLQAAAQDWFM